MRFSPERVGARAIGLFADFRLVWYTCILIIVLGLVITILETPYPFLIDLFKASTATPWGVFSSIFLHYSFRFHYVPNAIFLVILCLCFAITNEEQPAEVKKERSRFFAVMVFACAVFANILFILLAPNASSYGSSGTVNAAIGIVLGFALDSIIPKAHETGEISASHWNRRNAGILFIDLLIFGVFLWLILTDRSLFLTKGNANDFVHGVAFLAAFLVTTPVYTYTERRKISKGGVGEGPALRGAKTAPVRGTRLSLSDC